jgi:hypothetical protein
MQPDYTFALQFNKGSAADRAASIRKRLLTGLAMDPARLDCVLFNPKQTQRLVKLTDDLAQGLLFAAAPPGGLRLRKAEILGDVVT